MHFIPLHCKLDRKRRLKYAILLLRLCDPVELIVLILLTCTRKTNLSELKTLEWDILNPDRIINLEIKNKWRTSNI